MIECKVRFYHLEDYGDNGIKKIDDRQNRVVNILFNKSFYSPIVFSEELTNILNTYLYNKIMTPETLKTADFYINLLIQEYENENKLSFEYKEPPSAFFKCDELYNLY